jgi:hypothetical protein
VADLMGTVLNVDPLLVLTDASDTPVPALSLGSYSPVMSDRVAVERHGRRLLVLGVVGPPALEVVTGTVNITPSAANTPTSTVITFPDGRFSAVPTVQVTPLTAFPGTFVTGVGAFPVSISGATLWIARANTVTTTLMWLAVNIPADS